MVVPTPDSFATCDISVSPPISSVPCPNCNHAMPTPVSPTALRSVLVGYDGLKSQYLINGFRSGFQIGCFDLPLQKDVVTNMKSAFEFSHVIDKKLQRELALGRILGPLMSSLLFVVTEYRHLGLSQRKCRGNFASYTICLTLMMNQLMITFLNNLPPCNMLLYKMSFISLKKLIQ